VLPLQQFQAVWARCDLLPTIHAYLAKNTAGALQPDELLRAEWAARVSALDLYVHEVVAQRMVEIFDGARPTCPAYFTFQVAVDTLQRIRSAPTASDARSAFDLYVRQVLERRTFQFPDDIADGVRLCSGVELWNAVAVHQGATAQTKVAEAKRIKRELKLIVERRNKIVHEGDLQPAIPRTPWPISQSDLVDVRAFVSQLVNSIDAVA
jgi:hypothetical protein